MLNMIQGLIIQTMFTAGGIHAKNTAEEATKNRVLGFISNLEEKRKPKKKGFLNIKIKLRKRKES